MGFSAGDAALDPRRAVKMRTISHLIVEFAGFVRQLKSGAELKL